MSRRRRRHGRRHMNHHGEQEKNARPGGKKHASSDPVKRIARCMEYFDTHHVQFGAGITLVIRRARNMVEESDAREDLPTLAIELAPVSRERNETPEPA